MSSETTSTIITFAFIAIGFAILWKIIYDNRQCKIDVGLCSSFEQCSYYHPLDVTKDLNDLLRCGVFYMRLRS